MPPFDTQYFHIDTTAIKLFKVIYYLNDVDLDSGPFCYVDGSHNKLKQYWNFDKRPMDKNIIDEYFEIYKDFLDNPNKTNPGSHCLSKCGRPAVCGEFPVIGDEKINTRSRGLTVSKTNIRDLEKCERKAAWNFQYSIPRDKEDSFSGDFGITFHNVAQKMLVNNSPHSSGDVTYSGANSIESGIPIPQKSMEIVEEGYRFIRDDAIGDMMIKDLEKEAIKRTLKFFNNNRRKTARSLGMSERTLYRKIEEFGLEPKIKRNK